MKSRRSSKRRVSKKSSSKKRRSKKRSKRVKKGGNVYWSYDHSVNIGGLPARVKHNSCGNNKGSNFKLNGGGSCSKNLNGGSSCSKKH
jgi:hypothetical protein